MVNTLSSEFFDVETLVQNQFHGVVYIVTRLAQDFTVFCKVCEPILIKGHELAFYFNIKT